MALIPSLLFSLLSGTTSAAEIDTITCEHAISALYKQTRWSVSVEGHALSFDGDIQETRAGMSSPRTAKMHIDYEVTEAPRAVVARIVEAHESLGLPIDFEIIEDRYGLHVVPKAVKDASGVWKPAENPLDTVVSLEPGAMLLGEALVALFQAIEAAGGRKIVGVSRIGPIYHSAVVIVPLGKRTAREFLEILLTQGTQIKGIDGYGYRLAWTMTTDHAYLLNIRFGPWVD